MSSKKETIDFKANGVQYKKIEAYKWIDNRYSATISGTAKMIRQYMEQKYPMFTKSGVLWVRSRKFANGNSIDVYFNRIPQEYFTKINREITDLFEYYDGHNYNSKNFTTDKGYEVEAGTKYLQANNYPPYDSKEKDEEAPNWDSILSSSSTTTSRATTTTSSRGSWSYGNLIKSGSGWKLYEKELPEKSTFVYSLVKDKETQPNREKWNEIRGTIYTQEAFKWNPKGQSFQKWGKIQNIDVVADNLFRILSQYYQGATPEPISTPTQEPTPTTTQSGMLRDITDEEAQEFADKISILDTEAWFNSKVTTSYNLFNDQEIQDEYVQLIWRSLEKMLKEPKFSYLSTDILVSSLDKVYNILENENYHFLNNFLSLYGFYGSEKERKAIEDYQKNPTKNLKPFKQQPTTTTEPTQKEKLEKAIKGLQYLADKGNEKAVKAIKGLKYLLNK